MFPPDIILLLRIFVIAGFSAWLLQIILKAAFGGW